MNRKFGWKPDIPDKRDYRFMLQEVDKTELPRKFSLKDKFPVVRDQKNLGCCTAEAVCAIFHYRELTDENPRLVVPSVLFQYYNTRILEGTVNEDCGATIRNAVKASVEYGFCYDTCWPFITQNWNVKPKKECYKEAEEWKTSTYFRIDDRSPDFEYLLKLNIFNGNPVAFGFSVYENTMTDRVKKTGEIPFPKKSHKLLGGHAVVMTGYDDTKRLFEFRNSWGVHWGQGGYGYIPYRYVTDGDLAQDFWVIGEVP